MVEARTMQSLGLWDNIMDIIIEVPPKGMLQAECEVPGNDGVGMLQAECEVPGNDGVWRTYMPATHIHPCN